MCSALISSSHTELFRIRASFYYLHHDRTVGLLSTLSMNTLKWNDKLYILHSFVRFNYIRLLDFNVLVILIQMQFSFCSRYAGANSNFSKTRVYC